MPPDESFDIDSALEDVANGLPAEDSGGGPGPAAPQTASPQAQSAQPSAPAAAAPRWDAGKPPSSWKKDYHETWPTLPEPYRNYIHERELQMQEGLAPMRQELDGWKQVLAPYDEFFRSNNLDPRAVTQRMLDAHTMLTMGTPEQKAEWGRYLLQEYGMLDIAREMLEGQSQQTQSPSAPLDPRIEQTIGGIQRWIQQQEAQKQAQARAAQQAKVEEIHNQILQFTADPKHEFANDVLPVMTELVSKGLATTLSDAYDKAIHLHPETRAKILQREIEKLGKGAPPARDLRPSSADPRPTKGSKGSWEDTVEETAKRIFDRA